MRASRSRHGARRAGIDVGPNGQRRERRYDLVTSADGVITIWPQRMEDFDLLLRDVISAKSDQAIWIDPLGHLRRLWFTRNLGAGELVVDPGRPEEIVDIIDLVVGHSGGVVPTVFVVDLTGLSGLWGRTGPRLGFGARLRPLALERLVTVFRLEPRPPAGRRRR